MSFSVWLAEKLNGEVVEGMGQRFDGNTVNRLILVMEIHIVFFEAGAEF